MPTQLKRQSNRFLRLAASIALGGGLLVALFGLLARPAQAATCTVPGSFATIQAAINNSTCSIITVNGATYFEHLVITRSLEIQGTGATTVDGSLTGRVVNIQSNVAVVISGTILQRGSVAGDGGGISNQGQLTLVNSQVLSNTAKNGGGIYNGEALTATNVIVRRNAISDPSAFGGGINNPLNSTLIINGGFVVSNVITADIGEGGGVYNAGTASVLQTVLAGNVIAGNLGNIAFGGGLYNRGTAIVVNAELARNVITAALAFGGGLVNSDGSDLTILSSQVATNTLSALAGQGRGGGLNNSGRLTATNVVVASNVISSPIGFGAGLYSDSDGSVRWTGGQFAFNDTDDDGGGIYNDGALVLQSADTHDNHADGNGGGILNTGVITANNSLLNDNTAADGAGLYNSGFYLGTRDSLVGNTASDDGGGVFNSAGSLRLSTVAFNGNDASGASGDGGGMHASGGSVSIQGALLVNNLAPRNGGGLYASTAISLSAVSFHQNSAVDGGAIYMSGNVVSATNVTLLKNFASSHAGGLYLKSTAQALLVHATVASNTVGGASAAGISVQAGAAVTLTNSILAGNENANCEILGSSSETGTNLESGNTCSISGSLVNTDPLLGPLAFNGGEAPTAALKAGSPALDVAALPECAITDARGVARPQGAGCDLGAYEALWLDVADAAILEGNSGFSVAVFTVTVSSAVPGPQTVTATYSITGGTATAGVDFLAASGTLVIAAGQQSTVITATVLGDVLDEDVETFIVSLGNPTRALLGDAQAIGSIIDDDPLGLLYMPVLMHNSP